MKVLPYILRYVAIILVLSVVIDLMKGLSINWNSYGDEAAIGAAVGIFFYFRARRREKDALQDNLD